MINSIGCSRRSFIGCVALSTKMLSAPVPRPSLRTSKRNRRKRKEKEEKKKEKEALFSKARRRDSLRFPSRTRVQRHPPGANSIAASSGRSPRDPPSRTRISMDRFVTIQRRQAAARTRAPTCRYVWGNRGYSRACWTYICAYICVCVHVCAGRTRAS